MTGRNFGMTDEEWQQWLLKRVDDELEGCETCGAVAGCCNRYPNCPGNPDWKPHDSTV